MELRNIYIDGTPCDLTADGGIITSIRPSSSTDAPTQWALPGMVNMHTHSAMTLLRSVGSGLPLQDWLHKAIFPLEAKLTDKDIYHGASIACKEMKATGTTTFNDMYFRIDQTLNAAREFDMGGVVALSVTDNDFETSGNELHRLLDDRNWTENNSGKLRISIAPHSIYAVNKQHLQYLADFTAEHDLTFHIHISETRREREECIANHGVPPVRYLDSIGVLDKVGNRFIGAHALWLDNDEIRILADHKANVVHCPNSNMKLGSGLHFLYLELRDAGVNVTLGTDGCASSDNLNMVEAMKVMSLLQKGLREDPSVLPVQEVFKVATDNGYKALGLPPARIAVGEQMNLFTVDITGDAFQGIHGKELSAEERTELFMNRLVYAY